MTRLERLTTRYWRASTHLRRRHQDPAMADWEAWGLLADLQHRRSYPRLARAAESFLFPSRSDEKTRPLVESDRTSRDQPGSD